MKATSKYSAWRPDRFLSKFGKSEWHPARIERVGMDPLPLYKEVLDVVKNNTDP